MVTLLASSSVDSRYGCRVSNRQATWQDCCYFGIDSSPYRIRLFEQDIRRWYEEYGDDTYRHSQYGKRSFAEASLDIAGTGNIYKEHLLY